jgi:hypothetical protein
MTMPDAVNRIDEGKRPYLFYPQIVKLIQGVEYHSVIIGDIPSVFMI